MSVAQVVVFTGLPGTGKSTVAELVARELGAPAFAGDWLLGALKPHGLLTGLDRPAFLAMYYDLLTTLMNRQLMLGQSAVMDCLINDELVDRWSKSARQYDAQFHVIECVCSDEAEHRRRVETRTRNIPGWREVDWAHVERMRTEYPPLTFEHLTLDAVRPLTENRETVLRYLGRKD
ncbi:AAA family ATPase [Kribbella sp. NPDC006257]|uniref:AAA family ATPase n=1 Tax=Kribbella sp. NPDC006257 TaxID=3156738 RepID=UPI0033A2EDC9